MMGDQDVPVTASQIAQMAGVRPSAVSNWRRRSLGFPEPIGAGPRGADLFSRDEVLQWLRDHGYEPAEMDATEDVSSRLHTMRGVLRGEDVVTLVARWLLVAKSLPGDVRRDLENAARHGAADQALRGLRDVSRGLPGHDEGLWEMVMAAQDSAVAPGVEACLRDMSDEHRAALLEGLLDSSETTRLGLEHRTSSDLAALLVDLAAPIGGVVCDPAVGLGDILMAVGTRARSDGTPLAGLMGQTLSPTNAWVAAGRLALSHFDAEIEVSDALADGGLDRGLADVVLCDPPYGVTLRPGMLEAADERWFAGTPSGRAYEFAWIQHALWLTRPGSGRAFVVTPLGSTFAGGRANEIRRELVSRGMVEAIISLPAGSAGRATSIALAVWVLRWPTSATPTPDVIFIDAARRGSDRRQALTPQLRADIVRCLAEGRSMREPAGPDPVFINELDMAARASVAPGGPRSELDLNPAGWVGEAALEEFYGAVWEDTPQILSSIDQAWHRTVTLNTEPVDENDIPAPHRLGDLIAGGQVSLIRGARLKPGLVADEGVPIAHAPGGRGRFLHPSAIPADAVLTEPGDVLIHPSPAGHALRVPVVDPGGEVIAGTVVCLRSMSPQVPPRLLAAAVEAEAFRRPPSGTVTLNYTSARWLRDVSVPRMSEPDAWAAAEALEAIDELERELAAATQVVSAWRDLSTRVAASGRVRFPASPRTDPGEGGPA